MKKTLLMTPLITAGLLLLAAQGAGAASIYSFVDENGVIHLSNVPDDPRYRPGQPDGVRSPRAAGVGAARYQSLINTASRLYRVDPHLVRAVIMAESGFDRLAVSSKGAKGLMQLMPDTARDLRVRNPFDAEENIFGGTRYLKQLLTLFEGDLELALAAYNAGPNRVRSHGRIPPIPETRRYVRKVLKLYSSYRSPSSRRAWITVAAEER